MGPLISAAHRETVASFVPDDAPVAFRGRGARRAGLLVPADGARAGLQRRPRGARGDLRAGRLRDPASTARRRRSRLANDTIYGLSGSIWTRDGGTRAAHGARDRDRRALDQLEQLGAGLDPVRRLQAVRASAASSGRTRSSTTPRSRTSSTRPRRDEWPGRLEGKVCVITGAASGIGAESAQLFAARGGAGRRGWTSAEGAEGELSLVADVTDEEQVARCLRGASAEELGRIDVLFNNAGINPTDDESVLETDARGLAAGPGRQRALGLPLLQARDPAPARTTGRRRVGDQHGVVRRRDGRRRLADLLHRLEGRGAAHVARARRSSSRDRGVRVNALCPGPVNTPLLRELFAKDPEKAAQAARPHADGPLRRAGGDRERGALPRQRRAGFVTATTFLVDGGLAAAYVTPGQVD